ncbi:MAG: hypothetical protein JF597_00675 [Streptomyces sp.]|uniref:hypothetical protein n=1 Tax=Streptomyces sp. TaxID=1931 RepID=UPI0025F5D2C4|nr:hypothetical protein [Streptomyces sp.]MBW8792152.1 hypothetical protein [Streptomyces sp.]
MPNTPEEKAVIKAALRWQRKPNADTVADLLIAVQALRISRRPLEGPEPIPCMARARHSATMFCTLPKGHDTQGLGGYGNWHEGLAADGSHRTFYTEDES